MTSLLNPLTALVMMGGMPLAQQASHIFVAPASTPALVQFAQAAPAQADPEAQTEQADSPAPVTFENDKPESAELSQPNETIERATPPEEQNSRGALSDAQREDILQKAANALAEAKTAKGRFTQVAPDGSVTYGDFALRRPGRMRFDYDAPTPILIVSDGTTVAMEDSDLETVDRVPLGSTPLGLILDDELDFQTEARVIDVRRGNDQVAITLEDRKGESEGQLTLYFDADSYQLLSWQALDANRQTTLVRLDKVKTNVGVDPRLFLLDDPADEEDER